MVIIIDYQQLPQNHKFLIVNDSYGDAGGWSLEMCTQTSTAKYAQDIGFLGTGPGATMDPLVEEYLPWALEAT